MIAASNHPMKSRLLLSLLAVLPLLTACRDVEPKADSTSDQALAALEALPYLTWDKAANPKNRGVTLHSPESSWGGINLYTNDVDEAYLMDMDGRRLHTWYLPESSKRCNYFELLKDGDILAICVDQWLARLSWDSKVQWKLKRRVHHDLHVLGNGSTIVPFRPKPKNYQERKVKFDGLLWISPKGKIESRWSSFNNLDNLKMHHPVSPLDDPKSQIPPRKRFDYYHLNSVQAIPATPLAASDSRFRGGNILICLRNVSTIVILDQDTLNVAWSWGWGELEYPHMPTMLPNGNILIFDNGVERRYSRVVEVNPVTERIVWTYQADPVDNFFSEWRGSAQRLPNGNTLICEADRGRVFEVTAEGQIVWEFWNPDMKGNRRRRIYRFLRMDRGTVKELIGGDGRIRTGE